MTERFLRLDRDTTTPALLAAVHDPSPDVGRRAVGWLARSAGPHELAELRTLVWTCDLAVVPDVAGALRALGDRGARDDAAVLLRTGAPAVRCRAAAVLGHLGDRRTIGPLCAALTDRDGSVRGEALDALSRFGADDAAAEAAAALVGDREPDVRRRAIRSVARLATDLPPTVRAATADPVTSVRREVARVAARLPVPAVQRLAADPDREVRRVAVGAAGRGSEQVLTRVLVGEPDAEVRLTAAQTLGRLGGPRAAEALVATAIDDEAANVRAAALRGARSALSPERLLDLVRDALAPGAGHCRPMALRTLAKLMHPVEHADALRLAGDSDPEVRLALAQIAPDLLSDPGAILAVLRDDDDPTVAHAAYLNAFRASRERERYGRSPG